MAKRITDAQMWRQCAAAGSYEPAVWTSERQYERMRKQCYALYGPRWWRLPCGTLRDAIAYDFLALDAIAPPSGERREQT